MPLTPEQIQFATLCARGIEPTEAYGAAFAPDGAVPDNAAEQVARLLSSTELEATIARLRNALEGVRATQARSRNRLDAQRGRLAARRQREAVARRVLEEGAPLRATPERARHDPVLELPRAPFDDRGPDSRPQRVADRWIRMAREGTIDGDSLRAAHQFRRDFARAGHQALHALQLTMRVDGGGGAEPDRTPEQIDAGNAVWCALEMLGGLGSPTGSLLWTCVGLDHPVKLWCIQAAWARKPYDEKRASGILIGALSALAAHYRHHDARDEVRKRFVRK